MVGNVLTWAFLSPYVDKFCPRTNVFAYPHFTAAIRASDLRLRFRYNCLIAPHNITARHNDEGITARHNDEGITARHNDEGITARHNDEGITARYNDEGITARHNDEGMQIGVDNSKLWKERNI